MLRTARAQLTLYRIYTTHTLAPALVRVVQPIRVPNIPTSLCARVCVHLAGIFRTRTTERTCEAAKKNSRSLCERARAHTNIQQQQRDFNITGASARVRALFFGEW